MAFWTSVSKLALVVLLVGLHARPTPAFRPIAVTPIVASVCTLVFLFTAHRQASLSHNFPQTTSESRVMSQRLQMSCLTVVLPHPMLTLHHPVLPAPTHSTTTTPPKPPLPTPSSGPSTWGWRTTASSAARSTPTRSSCRRRRRTWSPASRASACPTTCAGRPTSRRASPARARWRCAPRPWRCRARPFSRASGPRWRRARCACRAAWAWARPTPRPRRLPPSGDPWRRTGRISCATSPASTRARGRRCRRQ